MDPREALKRRLEARKAIQNFFTEKRKALKVGPFWDFSVENKLKRNFLKRMNAIARDLEHKAIIMAEKGESWEKVLEEAKEKLEKLKEEFMKELGKETPWGEKFKELMNLIRNL